MDIQAFQLFITLSDTLHFGRTGKLMHMSPSAVSRAVQRIEAEVGQPLLERDNRRVRLTAAGRKFRDYAREAIARWRSFSDTLAQDATHLQGELAVYCSVTAVYSVLSDVMELFRRRYPDIDILLHTGDQADAIEHLLAGTEDIAITAHPDRLPASLQFQTLTHSPLLFIYPSIPCPVSTSVRRAIAAGQSPHWELIPFIVSERGQARVQLDRWFQQQHIHPKLYAQVSGHEAIVSMVALGFGVGVVPDLVLNFSPLKEKVQVLDVQPPLLPFSVGLSARTSQLKNPLVKAFWECAGASYREPI